MAIRIIEADVEKDIEKFVALLNRNRDMAVGRERFEWLYLNNPYGKARVWFAVDEKNGKEIAFTCALPRLMKVDGSDVICWNCGDFSVDRRYRTMGVALKLRRRAKDCVEDGEVPGFYAHPSDKMALIHNRVGHSMIGKMNRYVKLLRVDRKLQQLVKSQVLTRFLSPLGNGILRFKETFQRVGGGSDIRVLTNQEFGLEFDALFENARGPYRVIGNRGADYLNWRYARNPLYPTERAEIWEGKNLLGYVIFKEEGGAVFLKDILCIGETAIRKSLLAQWVRFLRSRGIFSISAALMNGNPMIKLLLEAGFLLRPDESSVYAYAKPGSDFAGAWLHSANWYMTAGDRDV